jgi:phosphoglycolate phosphatase
MQELRLAPADCFVIGDEPVDMAGGKKAGAKTIGVPKGFYSDDELKQAGADYIVSSLNLLPEIVQR